MDRQTHGQMRLKHCHSTPHLRVVKSRKKTCLCVSWKHNCSRNHIRWWRAAVYGFKKLKWTTKVEKITRKGGNDRSIAGWSTCLDRRTRLSSQDHKAGSGTHIAPAYQISTKLGNSWLRNWRFNKVSRPLSGAQSHGYLSEN